MYHNISGSLETFKAMTLPKKVKIYKLFNPGEDLRFLLVCLYKTFQVPSAIFPNLTGILIWKTNVPGQSLTRPVDSLCWNALLKAVDLANFSDSGIVVEKRFSINPEAQDVFQWRWTLILCFILTHVLDPFVENPSVQIYFTDPETRCVRFLIFVLFEFQSNFNSRSRSRSG